MYFVYRHLLQVDATSVKESYIYCAKAHRWLATIQNPRDKGHAPLVVLINNQMAHPLINSLDR